MLAWVLAQAATPTFTVAQARAMTPAQLADAMLEQGHPPIRDATVHPIGMEAPSASLQAVTLVGVPGPAPERGWCRQVNWRVTLAPVDASVNAYTIAIPTQVAKREPWELYRRAAGRCDDAKATFFPVRPEVKAEQLALVGRMVAARRLAAGRKRLPFMLDCRDEDGARNPVFGDNRCGRDGGRALLAGLAVERAYNVSVAGASTVYGMRRTAGATAPGTVLPPGTVQRPAELGMYDGALVVDVTVGAEPDGRITAITLKRHIPYPF